MTQHRTGQSDQHPSYPPPPVGYGYAPYPPPPPRRGVGRTIAIGLLRLVGVVLALVLAIAVFGNKGTGPTSSPSGAGAGAVVPTSDSGPSFPGKKNGDIAVAAGATLAIDGVTVTSTALRRGDSTFGKTLCTTLSYVNESSTTASFGVFDYKLQDPNGAIVNRTFFGGGNGLGSGELAPGGKVTGDLCFEDKAAAKGSYIVLFEPSIFVDSRGAFINQR